MKIIVKDGQRAMLRIDGVLRRVLRPGRHVVWRAWRKIEVETVDLRETVRALPAGLEHVLAAEDGEIVDVPADHAALVTSDGTAVKVLHPGRWVVWRGDARVRIDHAALGPLHTGIPVAFWPLAGDLVREVVVRPFERALVYLDGVLAEVLGAGRHGLTIWQRHLDVVPIDLREQELQVTGQELISADKATLRLNLLLKYRVVDPVAAVERVHDLHDALYAEIQIAARVAVAGVTLDALLDRRVELAREMVAAVAARAAQWGIDVRRLEIKDVILPGEMRTLMNQVIEAEKRAAAQAIARREEVAATRSLANTARMLEQSPVLQRLKEAELLERLAERVPNLTVLVAPKDLQDILKIKA